ncbi:TPA: hypothetical protein N0F65_002324 [Lagenidium giganteum]|uniref:DUF659 domain-containing protein n=1 Tax=Lagenidium giganteum TaxID=4803 RepID=A0AAV2Z6K4_9STRA|nr:TPA: hypothetical protein N0F65_002324 [Lagenidium giganteum]
MFALSPRNLVNPCEWICNLCGHERRQDITRGYSNLRDLQRAHTPESVDDAYRQRVNRQRDLSAFVQVSPAAINIHNWIKWIVMENRELSMCDKMLTHNYTNLERVSSKTLKGHMMEVCEVVEEAISQKPRDQKIGLVFVAWTKSGYQFLAVLATTTRESVLLAFQPMKSANFGADAMIKVDDVLDKYEISLSQLCFLVGDHASTNLAQKDQSFANWLP